MSREERFAQLKIHPWEGGGARHCGAAFESSKGKVFDCRLDRDHAGEHCGDKLQGRWFWADGDTLMRPARSN